MRAELTFAHQKATASTAPHLSIEDVPGHLDEIRDEAGYTVPDGPADEMSELLATLMRS
ncbi:hypothetical protein MSIMFI_05298 [Mycobacterium simulans]|uniref:hypothetical protein n=1 Tax=Mycobacterium simulans TaxID=627089 RepID=UPI0019AF59CA|nr:hypothetical protein [Mycobacterium simulans]SON63767.1 hypothetical protein MSIMFI_05298 [Mycobacterium simulans]